MEIWSIMAQLKNTTFNDTGSLALPAGTTAQRPVTPSAGMIRYNTTISDTEYYDGAAWRSISDSNPEATGGTIVDTDIGGVAYRVHVFTNTGTSTFNVIKGGEVEYLIVAGGGGGGGKSLGTAGGTAAGSGGGAGGLLTGTITVTSQSYTIGVGTGGRGGGPTANGGTGNVNGEDGNNSLAFGLTAIGGGGGAGNGNITGRTGGSGGGTSGPSNGGTGTAGQGNNGGGNGISGYPYSRAGGGGAGSPGGNTSGTGSDYIGGAGGNGVTSNIIGISTFYAGGGGGAAYVGTGGTAGIGGGTPGGNPGNNFPDNAVQNSGGGGGGQGGGGVNNIGKGGNGGSGIVVIRYRRNISTAIIANETRTSFLPYYYNRDVRTIIVRDGLVLDLDAANPLSYPGSGTVWKDLSGNGNDGTLVNGAGYISTNSGALTFDGVNDYVSVTPQSAVTFGTQLTYEVWIYPTDYTDSGGNRFYLIDPRGNGNTSGMNSYFLYDYINGTDTVRITSGNSGAEVQSDNFSMPLNRWHHILVTRNSTSWVIYFNGQVLNTRTSSSSTSLTLPATAFRIMTYAAGSSGQHFYEGRTGNVKIYNRTLAAQEVQQNFNALRGRYGI
jgi:hypothetical protein